MNIEVSDSTVSVVPLHQYSEYLQECCQLLNSEWKRSDTARLHSLKSSCDNLPTCLILLKDKELLGHCKLSVIPSIKDACFVESVVIDKKHRGNGYGSHLMQKAHEYCKINLKLKTVYLSTKDQVSFYFRLGYSQCEPVSIYGGSLNFNFNNNFKNCNLTTQNSVDLIKCNDNLPPAPPLPTVKSEFVLNSHQKKIFMKLEL